MLPCAVCTEFRDLCTVTTEFMQCAPPRCSIDYLA